MPDHDFTLRLIGKSDLTPGEAAMLIFAGCDSATIVVRDGRVILDCTRGGPTRDDAIRGAISDMEAAGFRAEHVAEGA